MKIQTFVFTAAAAVFAGLLAFSGIGFAAKGGIPGPPTDGGSGAPPDLGDLIVLNRDVYGRPIPTAATQVPDPETGVLVDAGLCQQPIGLPSDSCPLASVCTNPAVPCLVPVDPYSCGVLAGYETCTQEVDFGRTSVIRSPVSVLEQSLEEAVTKLATAQCTSLDPAGRLVNTSLVDGEVLSAAIDSPLENLAIYRQLMLTGDLGAFIVLPNSEDPMNVLNTAARGLGAAADKTGKVTVDQVVYSNQIMGLLDVPTYLPKLCVTVREEVQGNMQEVQKCVLDYSAYGYTRSINFGALPAPAYIPADAPQEGWFEYLGVVDPDATPVLFKIIQGPILDNVFGTTDSDFDGVNVGGFTQAADDTREVIEFTHDRPLPLGYATPVPLCDAPDTDVKYDLSLSAESGLQVPKQIVDGSEGREFTVTVANAGPDDASGSVLVTADAANGVAIEGSPWTITFTDLGAGASYSKTTFFSINLGARTTIAWTATAIPDCTDCDTNPGNNTVTATSSVRVTGSGGQGGRQ
jgi:hypothetical protein